MTKYEACEDATASCSSNTVKKTKQQADEAGMRVADSEPMKSACFFTPAQIAAKYPLSTDTIYAACKDGLLTHHRISSRKGTRGKYLIAESDFLAWIESGKRFAGEVQTEDESEFKYL